MNEVDASVEDAGLADAGSPDAGMPDAGALVLTSTAFVDGGTFPVRYTCADPTTAGRVSIPLAWSAIPGARSYAVVMTDTSIDLIHWVLWDIGEATLALDEGVANVARPPTPAGASQTTSYDGVTFGYRGPCPPSTHRYRFVVSGLDVAALPQVSTSSTRAQVQTAISAHVVGSIELIGNYGP